MEDMLIVMINNPVAAGAGLAAMVCLAIWPLFRARSTMLMTYIGNNLALLCTTLCSANGPRLMNGFMAAQTVVAIMLVRWPRLRWIYYALMPMLALASLATWHGLPSFLAATAATLSTIGRMQTNEVVLRVLLLASTPFWAAHDLVVGSLPGLVADLLSMTTGAAMLLQRSRTIRSAMPGSVQRTTLPQRA